MHSKMPTGQSISSTPSKTFFCTLKKRKIYNSNCRIGINAQLRRLRLNGRPTLFDTGIILHSKCLLYRRTRHSTRAHASTHEDRESHNSIQAPTCLSITSTAPSSIAPPTVTPSPPPHHHPSLYYSPALLLAVIPTLSSLLYALISPLPAMATEIIAPPPGFFDFLIDNVQSLGSMGPIVFIIIVAIFESLPLFPTQPLSLASGMLFGAQKGAICMLTGTTLAAIIAFTIARGVGKTLAEKIIASESDTDIGSSALNSTNSDNNNNNSSNSTKNQVALADHLASIIQEKIEKGTWLQQAAAIFMLRMTPVIPFSASNYLLGLSPMPLSSYLAGTVAGMSFWAVGYASLGGASRSLLSVRQEGGAGALVGELLNKASELSGDVTVAGLSAAVVVAGVVGWSAWRQTTLGEK